MFEKVKRFITDLTATAVTITGGVKAVLETEAVFVVGGIVVIILATARAIVVVAEFVRDVVKHMKDKRAVGDANAEAEGVADGDGSP